MAAAVAGWVATAAPHSVSRESHGCGGCCQRGGDGSVSVWRGGRDGKLLSEGGGGSGSCR